MKNNSWTIEDIKSGIERFIIEYGRPPKAREWDKVEYLPSARTVQRTYGGLERLRSELGYQDHHYGKGAYRSSIAATVNVRGAQGEAFIKNSLIEIFGEEFVHEQKMLIRNSKKRIDFYVYSPEGNFAVDVFSCETMHDFTGNVNHKLSVYEAYEGELYFVLISRAITGLEITSALNSKKKQVKQTTHIVTDSEFLSGLKGKRRYLAVVE